MVPSLLILLASIESVGNHDFPMRAVWEQQHRYNNTTNSVMVRRSRRTNIVTTRRIPIYYISCLSIRWQRISVARWVRWYSVGRKYFHAVNTFSVIHKSNHPSYRVEKDLTSMSNRTNSDRYTMFIRNISILWYSCCMSPWKDRSINHFAHIPINTDSYKKS